jgi:Mg/Co/Ni transporter MgtE
LPPCSLNLNEASLFVITLLSVALGAALPLGLDRAGIDPSNASTTIQV